MNMYEFVRKLRKHHSREEIASAEATDDNRENETRHCGEEYVVSSYSGLADHHLGHGLHPDENISRAINVSLLKFLCLETSAPDGPTTCFGFDGVSVKRKAEHGVSNYFAGVEDHPIDQWGFQIEGYLGLLEVYTPSCTGKSLDLPPASSVVRPVG
jgi:hypothetical protein